MILKKFFVLVGIVLTFSSSSMALENTEFEISKQNGNSIKFSSTVKPKTWIGIYKKNTSNEWNNVLAWNWVKNRETIIPKIMHLDEGDYEARLFFNNSYTTEASINFHIGKNPGNQEIHLKKQFVYSHKKIFRIDIHKATNPQENDWVGVFKQGIPHIQENLLAWSYVKKDDQWIDMTCLHEKGLSSGEYDLVYFALNSYQEDGPTATLSVTTNLGHGRFRGEYEKNVLIINKYGLFKQENDWVGIFKKDAIPNRENILYWAYVRDGKQVSEYRYNYIFHFPSFENKNLDRNFKIILFKNDTYEIIGSTLIEG